MDLYLSIESKSDIQMIKTHLLFQTFFDMNIACFHRTSMSTVKLDLSISIDKGRSFEEVPT